MPLPSPTLPIMCEICGRGTFMTEEARKQHMKDKEDQYHRGGKPYPITCTCGIKFMTSMEMKSHEKECPKLLGDEGAANMNYGMTEAGLQHLKKSLDDYFENNVKMDPEEMRQAKNVAILISEHMLKHLRTRFEFRKLHISPIENVGSSSDGLKVAPADEFDMIIPIDLYESDWELVDGKDAKVEGKRLDAPGFWLVKKKTRLTTNMDPYLKHRKDGDYVSPGNLMRDLQRKIHKIIQKFKKPEGVDNVKGGVKGPSLYMQIEYTTRHGPKKKFDLDFVLEIRVGNRPEIPKLVAKRHPSLTQQGFLGDSVMALLWQESSATKESAKIREIREEGPLDCRKKCWKLVKALAMKNKHLGSVCTYFYKTLFLHLLDDIRNDAEWRDDKLAERFVDVFKKMEDVLLKRLMPLYFTPHVNMLIPRYHPMQVESVYYYVRKMNATGSHMQMFYGGPSAVEKKKEKTYTMVAKQRKEKKEKKEGATGNGKNKKRKLSQTSKKNNKGFKKSKTVAPKVIITDESDSSSDFDDFGIGVDDSSSDFMFGSYGDDDEADFSSSSDDY